MANPILAADIIDGIQTQKNYIKGQVDKNTAGWLGFTDASAATPVDGTGGAAPSVTWTISTSSPLRDSASFLWTHPASDTRGQGFSYDFTIDRADRYSVLRVGVDYEVKSGTFDFGDSTSVDPGDLSFWLFDVTNSVLIELTQPYLNGGPFVSEFQSSDSTSYRLIIFSTTVTATAYTMAFDSFFVGARTVTHGAIISDWVSYTPTFTGFGTVSTQSFWWRRYGDSVQIHGRFTSGTSTAVEARVSLPSGLTSDSLKLNGTLQTLGALGNSSGASTTYFGQYVLIEPSVNYMTFGIRTSTIFDLQKRNANSIVNTPDGLSIPMVTVPIVGWGSNIVTSADSGTRVVAFRGTNTAATTIGTAETVIPFTVSKDTHGKYITDTYTTPESGFYQICQKVGITNTTLSTAQRFLCMIYIDGATYAEGMRSQGTGGNVGHTSVASFTTYLNAGQTIQFRAASSVSANLSTGAGDNYATIHKVQSPQSIGMADKNVAIYETAAGQSITTAGVIVDFGTKIKDTMNSVTTGASWKWTANAPGFAVVRSQLYYQNISTTNGDVAEIQIRKNGSAERQGFWEITATTTLSNAYSMNTIIPVVAGDTIDLFSTYTTGPKSLNANGLRNWIMITLE